MVEHTCRECNGLYDNDYPIGCHSICPMCWNNFNTPEVVAAREVYQALEEKYSQQCKDGIISYKTFLEYKSRNFEVN